MKILDLHGVRHIDVYWTVKRFIEDNYHELDRKIITGNSREMKRLVYEVLNDYHLEPFLENDSELIF